MLSFLSEIIEVITFIPQYVMFAIETIWNLFMVAITVLFTIATSLIRLPPEPEVPEYISAINWFYPIGAVISVAVPVMGAYLTFLTIRWIYRKSGNL